MPLLACGGLIAMRCGPPPAADAALEDVARDVARCALERVPELTAGETTGGGAGTPAWKPPTWVGGDPGAPPSPVLDVECEGGEGVARGAYGREVRLVGPCQRCAGVAEGRVVLERFVAPRLPWGPQWCRP